MEWFHGLDAGMQFFVAVGVGINLAMFSCAIALLGVHWRIERKRKRGEW